MTSIFKEWFQKLPETGNAINQITELYKVHHPYIAEGYSDLLEDTEWGRY